VKPSLELEPCCAIQKESSKQTRMAVHVAIRNYTYKRKDKIYQTNEATHRRFLCVQKCMGKGNWKE
jgi:hypothetical protein